MSNAGLVKTPEVTGPSNITYEGGSTSNSIKWNYYQILLHNYSIYKDGKLEFKEEQNIGISITYSIDGLTLGEYNFTLVLYNVLDQVYTHYVQVIVTPDLFPSITHPADVETRFGDSGYNITWYPTDQNPFYYYIYKNDSLITEDTWISASPIFISLDDLVLGYYNFTIQILDLSNQSFSDTVFVSVLLDTESPEIKFYGNFTYDELSENKTLLWSATDLHPSSYRIYNDTIVIEEGNWNNDEQKLLNLSSYTLGTYNITFTVLDSFGNVAFESEIVAILDLKNPDIIGPNTVYTQPGSSENDIQWILDDEHPANFTVFIDGNKYINGSWEDYPFVDVELSGFSTGVYNFTIIVEDTSHNFASHSVRVYIDVRADSSGTIDAGSGDTTLFEIRTEYVLGAGFVASIVILGGIIRRRT